MTPTEKSLYAERIHNVWRKASHRAGIAIRAVCQESCDGTPPVERHRLMKHADHLMARASKLAHAEVRAVLGA